MEVQEEVKMHDSNIAKDTCSGIILFKGKW